MEVQEGEALMQKQDYAVCPTHRTYFAVGEVCPVCKMAQSRLDYAEQCAWERRIEERQNTSVQVEEGLSERVLEVRPEDEFEELLRLDLATFRKYCCIVFGLAVTFWPKWGLLPLFCRAILWRVGHD